MSELSPDARDLIAHAKQQRRELLGPSAEQRARLRERLAPLWAAEAAPARSPLGARWKIAAVVAIAGLGLWSWLATHPAPSSPVVPKLLAATVVRQPPNDGVDPAAGDPCVAPDSVGSSHTANGNNGLPCTSTHDATSLTATSPNPCPADCTPRTGSLAKSPCSADCTPGEASPAKTPCSAECAPGSDLGLSSGAACPAECMPRVAASTAACSGLGCAPRTAAERRAKGVPLVAARASQRVRGTKRGETVAPLLSEKLATVNAPELVRSAASDDADDPLAGIVNDLAAPRAATTSSQQLRPARANARPERLPLRAADDRTPERPVRTDPDPAPPSIDGELELLGAAQNALQKQRPSRALTLLQEHAFRFPSGALIEERMAMQALALCALQRRHAAVTVLDNLAARGSQSQLLPRVRSQCGL